MKNVEVVAAIIQNGDKFLATKRGYGEFKGLWEFPGGKIDAGETNEEALIREIKEELNCDIKIDEFKSILKSNNIIDYTIEKTNKKISIILDKRFSNSILRQIHDEFII